MRKRKNTGKLLSILLCLMMVLGMLPITAQAEELGKVPGSSDTNTYEKADIKVEISVVKHVQQTGTETPPAETFEFEVEDTARGEKHPLSYYGIGVEELKLSTNDGVGDVEKTFSFKVSWTNDYADYHWDAVPKSGTDTVAWYSKTFLLREENDNKPGWNYSNAEYALTFWYDIADDTMDLRLHQPGNDVYYDKAEFTNTYNGTRYELPFTKTVKLGGSAAPGRETFELEIFNVGNGSMEEHAKDLYTAAVTTNGAGVYESALVISGPADQVRDLVCEGFYVREKKSGAANWSYSDEVWFVSRKQVPSVPGDGTVILPGGFPGKITPTDPEREYTFKFYPATAEVSDNGIFYDYNREDQREKMTFTNTYTYHTSVIPTGAAITANKTDAQGKALAGATFVLEDSRGREAYQATSNTSGTVRFTDVSSGTYTLLEKKAPEGYVLSDEAYTLTVSGSRVTMNGKAYSPVTFVNHKAAELNRTDHFIFLVGYTDGTFGPERDMTRAEVTTMFARLLTEQIEADKTYSSTFSDVPKGYWAANYIGYMQQFGIITGYSDGSFRPDAPVTRAEFAAIASRFEKLTEGSKSFADVPDTYWAARYIDFAATRGWVTGYSDGTFKPEDPITRAEVAAATCRLLERSADQSYIRGHLKELRTFADMTESHWAYWYAMEAANGHDYTKSGGSESWSRTYR